MVAKVLIADGHGIVRQGMRSLLERQPGVEVVAGAEDGVEVLSLIHEFRPNILIIDDTIPNLNETGGLRKMLNEFTDMKVLVLSDWSAEEFVRRMFEAGISGYILKEHLFRELATAVKIILEGDIYLSPAIRGINIGDYVKPCRG